MFTLIAFGLVAIICLLGLFHQAFEDNWGQHIGMIIVGTGSILKFDQIHDQDFVSNETMMIAIGVACYALGTLYKVRKYWRDDNPPHQRSHHVHVRDDK